ncbi:glycosyltransferase family 2 protein [Geobacter sp.]|uniref:glycosyltransferase family 2 protein n=1 Tax=Geobacter sp. TaxID=46610 RepID=UPI00262BFAF0|nr:glycosyltransferase family 2 protein [Geobacter sp.]
MAKIAAVINTRNEETNIAYCLESVKWCDEIVVVDMESEDRTVQIAQQYTDRVFNHDRILAFDAARKFAVERAQCEWILLVDADELIPRTLAERLKEVCRTDEADAVFMPFMNYLFGKRNRHTGWWPDYHCRFFKKEVMSFSEKIHAYQRLRDDARTITLPAEERYAVQHFAYRDAEQFIAKLNRYTSIEASAYFAKGVTFSRTKLLKGFIGEFLTRYVGMKGYRDGIRGLFVSLLMGTYRMVSYIKLWELYEYRDASVSDLYNGYKSAIIDEYRNTLSRD